MSDGIDFSMVGQTAARAMEQIEEQYEDKIDATVLEVAVGILVEYKRDGSDDAGTECFVRFSSSKRYVQIGVIKEMEITVLDGDDAEEEDEDGESH